MQQKLSLNGVAIKQPDKYEASLATTSTEDSSRDMSWVMHNTPIGTASAYKLTWTNISATDASLILKQVMGKSQFTAHYFDILENKWLDAYFYAANFSSPAVNLIEGVEKWSSLSFQITRINPS